VATLWTRTTVRSKTDGEKTRKAFLNTIHHMKAGEGQGPVLTTTSREASTTPAGEMEREHRAGMEDLKSMHRKLEDEVEALTKALLE
jgi:hypothetical protein